MIMYLLLLSKDFRNNIYIIDFQFMLWLVNKEKHSLYLISFFTMHKHNHIIQKHYHIMQEHSAIFNKILLCFSSSTIPI
jgi:hypothetical protein